jgi:DNA-binding NtrC family response regulator
MTVTGARMARLLNYSGVMVPATAGFPEMSPQTGKKSPGLRILVVDDEPLIRWSLAEVLAESGHAVEEAGDGVSAVAALSGGPGFDVVILDFRLPDANDLSLLDTIRQVSPRTRIIMMTAFGTPEMVDGALELGAYRVVPKPFDVHAMARLVAEAAQPARGL